MKLKRLLGAGVAAGLAFAGLAVGAPSADATVRVGAINCTAATIIPPSTPLGEVAIRNPSTSRVHGPVWAGTNGAPASPNVTLTNPGGITILPRSVGPATIGSFKDLVNTSQIVGMDNGTIGTIDAADTVVEGLLAPGGSAVITPAAPFLIDPDLADNGGVPDPVPMDGATPYPGNGLTYAPPAVTVLAPLVLLGTPGIYSVVTDLDPGASTIVLGTTVGNPGAMIISPDVTIDLSTGTADGVIDMIATSTKTTAVLSAPIPGVEARTTCAPSAEPTHRVNVQTDGGPIVDESPVVACDPATAPTGVLVDSKGWYSSPGAAISEFKGTMQMKTRYDGCRAPDAKLDAWQASGNGAAAAEAVKVDRADIQLKAAQFGDCTNVDIIDATGQSHNADSDAAYQPNGTIQAKYLDTANKTVSKVKGTQGAVAARLVIDNGSTAPQLRLHANGIATKGAGAGGAIEFVSELDEADDEALGILACNSPGYVPPVTPVFYGKLKTGTALPSNAVGGLEQDGAEFSHSVFSVETP